MAALGLWVTDDSSRFLALARAWSSLWLGDCEGTGEPKRGHYFAWLVGSPGHFGVGIVSGSQIVAAETNLSTLLRTGGNVRVLLNAGGCIFLLNLRKSPA
jgi:hypothetical protein